VLLTIGIYLMFFGYFGGLSPAYTMILTQSGLFSHRGRGAVLASATSLQSALTVACTYWLILSLTEISHDGASALGDQATLYGAALFTLVALVVVLGVSLAVSLRVLERHVVTQRQRRALFL
jgi:hypothetical protein